MWVAKMRFDSNGTLIGSKAKKYNLDIYGFPIFAIPDKEFLKVNVIGTITGKAKNITKFIEELKKESRTINIELNNNLVIATIKEPAIMKWVYNENIIHVSPVLISHKGYELIHISSFKREYLEAIIKIFREYKGKLIFIKQQKIKSISVIKTGSELTKKQQDAINLAIIYGYYNSPRKISVEKLAKIAKLSFSTYQVHLRKAESKLLPNLLEQ
jgi:predicted DNA binding protein